MGQYYTPYINRNGEKKVFSNKVDDDWTGLKLMEHSWWLNSHVGNVVNDLFYNKGRVCWVGDYYDENDYEQANESPDVVREIGEYVYNEQTPRIECSRRNVRYLFNCLIVNHTKKEIINCDDYYEQNKYMEKWDDEEWWECIHPLPLLTCSASHSGGSYYGINREDCGIWFNDEIEIMLHWELEGLLKLGYTKVDFLFRED